MRTMNVPAAAGSSTLAAPGTPPATLSRRLALRLTLGGALLAVLLAVAATPAAADDKADYRVVDPSGVYLGNPRLFRKPVLVNCDRVYRAIPEYVEILEKNLTDRDVRYHFLMRKASDKFAAAVRSVASEGGYDLVAGVGSVVPSSAETPAIPEATDAAIKKLPA
ncbi:MAG: hypothetical protein U1E39_12065 [Planctomycetota bacterium]